jgi:hypothetical protein
MATFFSCVGDGRDFYLWGTRRFCCWLKGGIVCDGNLHDAPRFEQRAVTRFHDSPGWEDDLAVDVGDISGHNLAWDAFLDTNEVHDTSVARYFFVRNRVFLTVTDTTSSAQSGNSSEEVRRIAWKTHTGLAVTSRGKLLEITMR